MEVHRPRRSLPVDLPRELVAVVGLLCVAGLFTGIPVLQDLPDAFKLLSDGGLWDSFGPLVVVLFFELGFFAVACFLLAWRLSQGDPVARVVTVVVSGSLAFGLLAGYGFDDGSATVTMVCSIAVMAGLLVPPRAREFFTARPPGSVPVPITAARALVAMLAALMLAVGVAFLPAMPVRAKYGFAGLALAGIAVVCLKDRRRLQTGDPAARTQVSGLMGGAVVAILLGNEGSLTGPLFIPLGMAVAIVGLLWLPKESQAFFDAGVSLDVDASDDEDDDFFAPQPAGPPPRSRSRFEPDPPLPGLGYPSSPSGLAPFEPEPAPLALGYPSSPSSPSPFEPDPAPPASRYPSSSGMPPFAPEPAPSGFPPPPPPPPGPPSIRQSAPSSQPTSVPSAPSVPMPPIPPPVFGRRAAPDGASLAAPSSVSGSAPGRPIATRPTASPPGWLLAAPPAGFWPPERRRADPRRFQVIEVVVSSPEELLAAPDLGVRFDTATWFPVLEAGEQVRGAYLVSMAMFDDGSATPAFRGTSTLLVTTARLVGVCARGDSTAGPLDPAVGRVAVWRVRLDQLDPVRAEGSAEGGHLPLKGSDSKRPWALLAKPRVAVEGAFRKSAPADLADLVNRAKHVIA